MRRLATLPVLLFVLLGALAACKRSEGPGGPGGPGGGPGGGMPPTAVETAKVSSITLPSQFETVGSLRADASVTVRPEVAGKIVTIHFQEGQHVAAGAPLFSLDGALAQAALNEASANLENSRRVFDRTSELSGRQLVSRADLDTSRAALGVNQARASTARTMLDKTVIRAPFAGTVGLRQVSVGDYVTAGQAMVDLVKLDPLQVDFRIPEAQLSRVAVGQAVKLEVDAFPGKTFDGTVLAIDPVIDAAGRSALLRARLPNPDGTLRPGLFARLRIVFGTNPSALMIPEQAIWPDGDQKKVFLVEGGKVKLVPVKLGMRQPGMVQVVEGLKSGDEVVTAGQMKLFDGASVTPQPAPTAPPAAQERAATPADHPAGNGG